MTEVSLLLESLPGVTYFMGSENVVPVSSTWLVTDHLSGDLWGVFCEDIEQILTAL